MKKLEFSLDIISGPYSEEAVDFIDRIVLEEIHSQLKFFECQDLGHEYEDRICNHCGNWLHQELVVSGEASNR